MVCHQTVTFLARGLCGYGNNTHTEKNAFYTTYFMFMANKDIIRTEILLNVCMCKLIGMEISNVIAFENISVYSDTL